MPVPPSLRDQLGGLLDRLGPVVVGRGARRVRLLRPVQMTVAPASPSAAAMPRPAPRVAPATTATRPRSASGSGVQVTAPVCQRASDRCWHAGTPRR